MENNKIQIKEKRLLNYGYFIAKIKNDNMQYILNRFNEKYPKKNLIHIRFFDENPLTVRQIRYNQGGAVCYCMENSEQGKQKVSNEWKPINCSANCKYRMSSDGIAKPMCNLEGTLKFLLPDISPDRIWIMKITGQTSIEQLKSYISLQKVLGNSLIGDYNLFLVQKEQTNKQGKSFKNYILDIVKSENFISNDITPQNQTNPIELSTKSELNVENTFQKSEKSELKEQKNNIEQDKNTTNETKKVSKKPAKEKKQDSIQNKETVIAGKNEEKDENQNFDNYYVLVDTCTKKLMKEGKPTDYLFANFLDMKDKMVSIAIPPQFAEELLKYDVGTVAKLSLKKSGEILFTDNIEYTQKLLKNVAA